MLSLLLCLSVPPTPPATVQVDQYKFAILSHADARALAGVPTTFRITLDSAEWDWQGCRTFEVQMRKGMFGTVYFEQGEDEDGADELVVSGTLRIIRQTDMKGRPYLEYRIERAVILK